MSTFEVLASEDFESKQARSRAITATIVRAQEAFDPFLSNASSAGDKEDRILLIEDDLKKIAYVVARDYGYDNYNHLFLEARAVLACTCEGKDCKECDCKECHGKTAAGPIPPSDDDHPDNDTGDEDEKGDLDGDEDKDWKKPWEKDSRTAADPQYEDSYQSERVKLPSASGGDSESVENGPSPKIDKGSAGDNEANSQKPIDVGSKRNEHSVQAITDRADYNNSDFDPSSPVRERVDAGKPMQPEYTQGDRTDTWSGTSGQAAPVTSGNAVVSKYTLVQIS